jgi:regulator of sigma E protease
MDILSLLNYVLSFLVVLSVVVFVHEWGHFIFARMNGVKVEVFSIGFGPELFGWTAKKTGTRWKISAIPMGGYVRMYGDADETSAMPDKSIVLDADAAQGAFANKKAWQRASIIFAGPMVNFVFAIFVFAGAFVLYGQPYTPPVVNAISPGSAAEAAGLQQGDRFLRINGSKIDTFEQVQLQVQIGGVEQLNIELQRDDQVLNVIAQPKKVEVKDSKGRTSERLLLGVAGPVPEYKPVGVMNAIAASTERVYEITVGSLAALGQIISGSRPAEDLGGPLRIAEYSGKASENGIISLIMFMGAISVSLGLINLFPIPMLDGGQLVFTTIEMVVGRPVPEKVQEYAFRAGMLIVLGFMLFATSNDIMRLIG